MKGRLGGRVKWVQRESRHFIMMRPALRGKGLTRGSGPNPYSTKKRFFFLLCSCDLQGTDGDRCSRITHLKRLPVTDGPVSKVGNDKDEGWAGRVSGYQDLSMGFLTVTEVKQETDEVGNSEQLRLTFAAFTFLGLLGLCNDCSSSEVHTSKCTT